MTRLDESVLYYVIYQYLAYYCTEHDHQGPTNQLIVLQGKWVVKRGIRCGENTSVACAATIIERQRDAARYFTQTWSVSITWISLPNAKSYKAKSYKTTTSFIH